MKKATKEKLAERLFSLGRTSAGRSYRIDLMTMPNLLIAGEAGMGKTAFLNSLIAHILRNYRPDEICVLLMDTRQAEFSAYPGIPHLATPVITDMNQAIAALQALLKIKEKREIAFRNNRSKRIDSPDRRALPSSIFIIIDEIADLMSAKAKDFEDAVCRLAWDSDISGIRMVFATRYLTTDVISGSIKNALTSRLAFRVPGAIESRIVLDTSGAEKIAGAGEALYLPDFERPLVHLHCPCVSAHELRKIALQVNKRFRPIFSESFIKTLVKKIKTDETEESDRYEAAVRLVLFTGKASASYLQHRLHIGFPKAARLIDRMESEGLIGPFEGNRERIILVREKDWRNDLGTPKISPKKKAKASREPLP